MPHSPRPVTGASAERSNGSERLRLPATGAFGPKVVITRHNPHPHRCVHISALQGCQVPSVVDDGIPLDLHICYPTARPELLRAAAARPNTSLSGLAKPQHLEQFARLLSEEKSESQSGGDPAVWRGALSRLTRETFGVGGDGEAGGSSPKRPNQQQSREGEIANLKNGSTNALQAREAQRLYSPLTGRLVAANKATVNSGGISKLELMQGSVMAMLCRILQTRDEAAVRAWLLAASPRERELVTDIIRSSVANHDEYFVESLPDVCSICRTGSRLATQSTLKSRDSCSGGGGGGGGGGKSMAGSQSRPADSVKSAGSAEPLQAVRGPNVVELVFDETGTEAGKPRHDRAVSPVAAAGKRTSLPSLLGGKSGDRGRRHLRKN